nr:unnamed protein product [Callosobruchus analis]
MRVTPQHWEVLMAVVEKHPNLITGKFNGAQGKRKATVCGKAVTDWKCKVKAKAAKLRQTSSKTGGGPATAIALSPLEEKLIGIMGTRGFEGDEGIIELGLLSPLTSQLKPNVEMQALIYQSVADEIEVYSEPQPSTSQTTIEEHEKINHKKHVKDHDYCAGSTKGKRMKTKHIQRVSQNLETISLQSLECLQNIEKHTGRIASALERIADTLANKQ